VREVTSNLCISCLPRRSTLTRSPIFQSFLAVLGLGAVLSALVLFVAAGASSGYILGEPLIVIAILIGGPLLAFATWSVLARGQRREGGHSHTVDVDGPGTSHSSPTEPGDEPAPQSALGVATAQPRSVSLQVVLLACGVALSIPMGLIMWFVLIAAATPLRGAAHLTELGTTWHDNDRIVRPLIGLAVGVLGCVLAKLLARATSARILAVGLAAGCIVIALLMGFGT